LAGSAGIIGFALDGSGKMCAVYDPLQATAGFAPPDNKLIRFIPVQDVDELSQRDAGFTCFGVPPAALAQQPAAEAAAARFRRTT
jgi:hypothetical protein